MKKISKKLQEEIKLLLPEVRKQVKKELRTWERQPTPAFYSDEAVLDIMPVATYEYMVLKKNVHLDSSFILYALNHGMIKELHLIMAHALRKLGFHPVEKKCS